MFCCFAIGTWVEILDISKIFLDPFAGANTEKNRTKNFGFSFARDKIIMCIHSGMHIQSTWNSIYFFLIIYFG